MKTEKKWEERTKKKGKKLRRKNWKGKELRREETEKEETEKEETEKEETEERKTEERKTEKEETEREDERKIKGKSWKRSHRREAVTAGGCAAICKSLRKKIGASSRKLRFLFLRLE